MNNDTKQSLVGRRVLLFWAVAATLAAIVSTTLAVFFFFQGRRPPAIPQHSTAPHSAFLDLAEAEIPGRYKLTEPGWGESFIVLNPDHSFVGKDGITYPVYHWEITRSALLIVWQKSHILFTNIESPGVFATISKKGGIRLEKQKE